MREPCQNLGTVSQRLFDKQNTQYNFQRFEYHMHDHHKLCTCPTTLLLGHVQNFAGISSLSYMLQRKSIHQNLHIKIWKTFLLHLQGFDMQRLCQNLTLVGRRKLWYRVFNSVGLAVTNVVKAEINESLSVYKDVVLIQVKTYLCQQIVSSLVQLMACQLLSTKPIILWY